PAPAAAGPFRIGVYVSPLQDPGTGFLIGTATVAGLPAATNSSPLTVMGVIPPAVAPGQYWISVVADYDNRVPESDETNNGLTVETQVDIRRADLTVTALTGTLVGRTLSVSSTVVNGGNAASGPFRVNFFISPLDPTPGAGRLIGFRDVSSLTPGVPSPGNTSITLPTTVEAGSYFLSAVADAGGVVAEGDETNNGLTAPIQLAVPATSATAAR
ncbi:MAG TPA: CARDB domain-containing protein, partial [Methylomirabilota bacterium]|nr:CARDB domain-containing protein [Methylomirabilota bacterium]